MKGQNRAHFNRYLTVSRKYFNASITELERLVQEHASHPAVLRTLYDELTYRSTDRARRLRAKAWALVDRTPSAPAGISGPLNHTGGDGAVTAIDRASQAPGPSSARDAVDADQALNEIEEKVQSPALIDALVEGDTAALEASRAILDSLEVTAGESAASVTDAATPDPQAQEAASANAEDARAPSMRAGADIPFLPLSDASDAPLAVVRTRQLFRFLRDIAQRNVPSRRTLREHDWSLALSSLPKHESITVGSVTVQTAEQATGPQVGVDAAPLVRVQRPTLTDAPSPPTGCAPWVVGFSNDPFAPEPTTRSELKRPRLDFEKTGDEETDALPVIEKLEANPVRAAALSAWQEDWRAWQLREQPAHQAMKVFLRLYELLGRIERESERVELMLGDGLLRRNSPVGPIDHPVLLQRVELQFDPDRLEFRIVDADQGPELYAGILQDDEGLSGDRLHRLQQELERAGFHPLGGDETEGFYRRLVILLSPNASVVSDDDRTPRGDAPTIRRDPVLFLRPRSFGMPAAMSRVLEDLENAETVPHSLSRVVGVDDTPIDPDGMIGADTAARFEMDAGVTEVMTSVGEPPDVLLSKPANLEQVKIARALERHGAVLVQGPPGTGKSHTIANLIGHLVAQGKRVLVTSHTTKALRVLREHIPETLRPLSVALLDQDLEGRNQLEQAVREIVQRTTASQEDALQREVDRLTGIRRRLMETVADLHEQLRAARAAEYEPVVVAGEAIEPVDAARFVRDERERHEWLPGPLVLGAPVPLSTEELRELYATNSALSPEEEHELDVSLPPRDQVVTTSVFGELISALGAEESWELARWWQRTASEPDEPELHALVTAVDEFRSALNAMAPWQRALVAAGRQGDSERDLWRQLGSQVTAALGEFNRTRPLLLDNQVDRFAGTKEDDGAIAEMCAHVAGGNTLGSMTLLFKPKWKQALSEWRVNGAPPSCKEHFEAIKAWCALHARRRALGMRWARQAVPVNLPPIDSLPEPTEPALAEYAGQFDRLTGWWSEHWGTIEARLAAVGFQWRSFRDAEVAQSTTTDPFERDIAIVTGALTSTLRARLAVARRLRAEGVLREQEALLRQYSSVIAGALRDALSLRDVAAWTAGRTALDDVSAKVEAWKRRRELLAKLRLAAPGWADAIHERKAMHGTSRVPDGMRAAWRWRQIAEELERRARVDERAVAKELERRRTELRETTCALIDRMTWLAQLRRTGDDARRALLGWADTQKRIGKGTGKRVPALQAEARQLLDKARDAVPVWIMSLARVAESFDPRGRKFDVVIVDEASQADTTGLLALYLAKRVVIVGDHEQVSPTAVGQKIDDAQRLIAQHLIGIPNAHLYDGQASIYDLARYNFGGNLALLEHFRCVPAIIEFSNQLSYNGQMRPLRDPSTASLPHVAEYVVPTHVLSTSSESAAKVNPREARCAAALLAAMHEMPEYAGYSFGAISLVGDEQAEEIQRHLLSLLGAQHLQARRFVAGNPAQFQGDERDVILLSMVDRPSMTGNRLPLRDTTMFKQRYNVAASRARNQLWLVHSLDPGRDLQPNDLRRRLIEHVRDPRAVSRAQAEATRRAESPFEVAVIQRLVAAGFRVIPQVEVGRYRIDMVVTDGKNRVALECDGDRFHPPEQIPEDIARQAVLERSGWRFIRLRGTRFYRDPDASMEWVFEELARLGVSPTGLLDAPTQDEGDTGLREAVVRRAWAIMQERGWAPSDPVQAGQDLGSDSQSLAEPTVIVA